ncbi:ras-related protein Rab-23 [Ischnura elegans]|uniref:ras-related protein Rab-23 n=1 Tax=Ischnura elegans TaxID=197161 RepID=UPI001ED887E9|nr:ras-related protein Rab-23 [Ischnura elegans]
MREEDLEIAIKVVIVGNGAVGKSSMIQRFCKGTFTKDYKKTIGVDFLERQIEISPGGDLIRLMLWDTAGQEEFDALTKAYYRGAHACLLAFSATDRLSFLAVPMWKRKVEEECGDIPMALVQNKIDAVDQCVVHDDEASRLAQAIGCPLFRTSVREGIGVSAPFSYLAQRCAVALREDEMYHDNESTIHGNDVHHLHGTMWSVGAPQGKLSSGRSTGLRETVVLRKGHTGSRRGSSGLARKLGGVLDGACQLL